MKLETYLVVNEDSIVGNFETITEACDFIRNVVICHCVSEIPKVVNDSPGTLEFVSKDSIVSGLKEVLPHYTLRKLINIKGYEKVDTSCDQCQ